VYKFKDEERREKGATTKKKGPLCFALHRVFPISLLKSFKECEKRFVFFSYSKRREE